MFLLLLFFSYSCSLFVFVAFKIWHHRCVIHMFDDISSSLFLLLPFDVFIAFSIIIILIITRATLYNIYVFKQSCVCMCVCVCVYLTQNKKMTMRICYFCSRNYPNIWCDKEVEMANKNKKECCCKQQQSSSQQPQQ